MSGRSSGACLAPLAPLVALALAGCASQGQLSHATAYGYEQSVLSGRVSEMGDYNTVSGDGVRTCHLQPLPAVRILRPPDHGEVMVTIGTRTIGVRPDAPLAYCDGRQFASRIVRYRSAPGYHGDDHLSYAVTFADGTNDIYEKAISVR